MKNTNKTITLTEEGYINLINLLTLTDVTEGDIITTDIDSACEVNVTEMLQSIKNGLVG